MVVHLLSMAIIRQEATDRPLLVILILLTVIQGLMVLRPLATAHCRQATRIIRHLVATPLLDMWEGQCIAMEDMKGHLLLDTRCNILERVGLNLRHFVAVEPKDVPVLNRDKAL